MLHYIWQYIQPADCLHAYAVCTSWRNYIALLIDACHLSIAKLQARCPPLLTHPSKTLCPAQARLYACALLRFHFNYGDFVRWLSGEYTNCHRQWTKDFKTLIATKARPSSADYPILDYP
jgi:hypothetical protein